MWGFLKMGHPQVTMAFSTKMARHFGMIGGRSPRFQGEENGEECAVVMANRCLAHLQTSQLQQCLEDVPTPRVRINAANLRVRMCSHVHLIYIYILIYLII